MTSDGGWAVVPSTLRHCSLSPTSTGPQTRAVGGADCTAPGEVFSDYENATGTGQAHVWFERPETGWTVWHFSSRLHLPGSIACHNRPVVALRDLPRLGDDLDRLASALEALALGPDLSDIAVERDRLARSIRSYLIPRAEDPETPLTVVFAGPTGSGKSTLINSLTGVESSVAGPLRPTTTSPVVLTSHDRTEGFDALAGVECEVVAGAAPVLDSMVFVDTPDIDSTSTDHRSVAETLIDNADVVVFVTSALRYADSVPWQVLRRARSRGTDVIPVLNRVESSTRGAVVDFKSRLAGAGLEADVVTVPEHHIAPGSQRVPTLAVQALRRRLATLAGARSTTADRSFDRVLRTTVDQIGQVDDTLAEVSDELEALETQVSLDLTKRVTELDLSLTGTEVLPLLPQDVNVRELRRWRRSARHGVLSAREVDHVVTAIEKAVSRDIRRWLAKHPTNAIPIQPDPNHILAVIMPVVRLAMEGWIDYVRRISREARGRWAGFAESVLVASATNSADPLVADVVLGEDGGDAVGRARRELIGRLEVVYEQVSVLVLDLVRNGVGDLDRTDLRSALGAVSSTLAPVDA